jgi:hypothetical protein
MQRPVWGYLSTERRIPTGCRLALANDTRLAVAVETHHLCVFTTAMRTPIILLYLFMKEMNKVIRLASIWVPLATEVVTSTVRSKIRYAGINYEWRITKQRSAVANYETALANSPLSTLHSPLSTFNLKCVKVMITEIKIWGRFCLSEATANLERTYSEATPKLQNRRKRRFGNK